jgi:hypothetical protein
VALRRRSGWGGAPCGVGDCYPRSAMLRAGAGWLERIACGYRKSGQRIRTNAGVSPLPLRLPFDKLRVAQGPVEMTAFVAIVPVEMMVFVRCNLLWLAAAVDAHVSEARHAAPGMGSRR